MKLLILGILMENSMHGYDLKKIIEERTGAFTNYKFGSIYFSLKKLTEEGYTIKLKSENLMNRPKRNIYEITENGKIEFIRLLEKKLKEPKRVYYSIDEGLFFNKYLPNSQILEYIRIHIKYVDQSISILKNILLSHNTDEMHKYQATLIIDHTLMHMIAEKKWLEKVEKEYIGVRQ